MYIAHITNLSRGKIAGVNVILPFVITSSTVFIMMFLMGDLINVEATNVCFNGLLRLFK